MFGVVRFADDAYFGVHIFEINKIKDIIMKKFNFLTNQLGHESYEGRKRVQAVGVSFASRLRVLGITMLYLLTLGVGNAWGTPTTYNFSSLPTKGWSSSGGSQTINGISWTYSSGTYVGQNGGRIQVGSKDNPQTTNWTIQTAISNFGSGKKITAVAITGYATQNASSSSYDISVGGSSVRSGSFSNSSDTYTASGLNVTSGNIVITLCGDNDPNTKALYLSDIAVTYDDAGGSSYTLVFVDSLFYCP